MRTLVALLALALAAGLLWWGLSRGDASPVADDGTQALAPSEAPPGTAAPPAPRPGGLEGAAPRPPRPVAPVDPGATVVSYGSLRIRLVPAEGLTVGAALRLDLEPLGAALSPYPLAVLQEDGTWAYERLPVGKYRVRVFAPGAQDAVGEATIKKDAEVAVTIPLAVGVEVPYRVAMYAGDAPDFVTVELLDGRGVRIGGSFHTGAGVAYVSASSTRRLPRDGRVVGLRPGPYRLRATSEAGETDEQAFDAKLGASPTVELKLRK